MSVLDGNEQGIHPLGRETIRKVAFRLVPLLWLGFFFAYLDRVNVSMAALTMNRQLGFSSSVFGFGAGLFFIGYFVGEIPSNLVLNKVGARRWIARIMLSWGILSAATAFCWNDWSFYLNRFLLGLAEAGFFPGAVLYLTWWFPSYYRSRMMGLFYSASVISMIVGPIAGGLLLRLGGVAGMHGWQWLFLTEGCLAVLMAVVIWRCLTDRPADATWLRPEQRAWLIERLNSEQAQREAIRKFSLGEALRDRKIWFLSLAWVGNSISTYGVVLFLPTIVRGLGVSINLVGLVSAVPYMFALVAIIFWGWHSDRTGDRLWHVVGAWALCAAGIIAAAGLSGGGHPILMMAALTVAVVGQQCTTPVFWSIPSALLTGTAAAGGLALINSVGNLGGLPGPWIFGLVKDATGSDNLGFLFMAIAPLISIISVIAVGHDHRLERMPFRAAEKREGLNFINK